MSASFNRRLTYLLLGLIVAGGLFIRIHNLGLNNFWIDELAHVNAAKSILATGEPIFAGGQIYTRALPFTYLVVGSFKLFGVSEQSARFPGVLFGTLAIITVFFITKKWFDNASALIASFLIAFAPLCVMLSRECRMYSLFQFLYLNLVYLSYLAVESTADQSKINRIIIGLATLSIFIFSLVIHKLTILFVPSFLCYLLVMFLVHHLASAAKGFFSKYLILIFFISTVIVAGYFLLPDLKGSLLGQAGNLPPWDIDNNNYRYYQWILEDSYPMFVYFYPVAVLYILMHQFKKGLYLFLLFSVPFVLMSFVFQRKLDRYFMVFSTFFLIGIAPVVSAFLKWMWNNLDGLQISKDLNKPSRRAISLSICLLVFSPVAYPWMRQSYQITQKPIWENWKKIYEVFHSEVNAGDVIITTDPTALQYYGFQAPIYSLNRYHLFKHGDKNAMAPIRDKNSGAVVISNLDELKLLIQKNEPKNIWFFLAQGAFEKNHAVPFEIQDYLEQNAEWYQADGASALFEDLPRVKASVITCKIEPNKVQEAV